MGSIPSQHIFISSDPGLNTSSGNLAGSEVLTNELGVGMEDNPDSVTQPFVTVEKMPEFEGGLTALYAFINKNLKYPRDAEIKGIEGNVNLSFVVNASGNLSDIQVLQDIGGGAGEEARRVIGKMPLWKPGIQNYRPVPVRFTLPIRFALN